MQNLAESLGQKIREERKTRGFSQEAIALACKLDRSYMGRIERGEVNITVEKLYLIALALECEPKGLLPEMAKLDNLVPD